MLCWSYYNLKKNLKNALYLLPPPWKQLILTGTEPFNLHTCRNGWILNNLQFWVDSWCHQLIRCLWWFFEVGGREETRNRWHLYLNVLRLLKVTLLPTEMTSVLLKCLPGSHSGYYCYHPLCPHPPHKVHALEGGEWESALWVDKMTSLKHLSQYCNNSLSWAEENSLHM